MGDPLVCYSRWRSSKQAQSFRLGGSDLSLSALEPPRHRYRSLNKFHGGLLPNYLAKLSVSPFKASGAL